MPPHSSPLMNHTPAVATGFNAAGYRNLMVDNLSIVNKDKQVVDFTPLPAQDSLLLFMEQYYLILILKARKMGFSSLALAVAVAKFILGRNERCVTMSFDAKAAEQQLGRAKHFITAYQSKNGPMPLKYNSKTEMSWSAIGDDGKPFTNTLRTGTAKSSSFGRGDDVTFLHLTEVAFCDDVPTLLAGVGEAVVHGAHILLETTANGFNSYKQFWDNSMLDSTGFAALFYDPRWEYDDAYLRDRQMKLGRLFPQEYPMTPEEAFLATGDTYIDRMALKQLLEDVMEFERRTGQPVTV